MDEDINTVGKPSPTIAAAYTGAERRVHLVLCYPDEVVQKTVDLTPILKTGRVYAPLSEDDALFGTLRVNEDGKSLEFDGGFKIWATTIEWLADTAPAGIDKMTGEGIEIDRKDISSHLRAAQEALERALEIFHDDYAARHETASAISDVEVAHEIIGKLVVTHAKPDDEE